MSRFTKGQRFHLHENLYVVREIIPHQKSLLIEDLQTLVQKVVTIAELTNQLFNGELSFVNKHTPMSPEKVIDMSNYSKKKQEKAKFRLWVIEPLLDLPQSKFEHIQARIEEVKSEGHKASKTSVYRWLKNYEESNRDIRSLLDGKRRGGKGKTRLNQEVIRIMEAVINEIYMRREKCSIDTVWLEVNRRVYEENQYLPSANKLTTPHRNTIANHIERMDLMDRFIAKEGKRKAKHKMTQFNKLDKVKLPLQRVEIDHTVLDLIVVDEEDFALGRPTLTYCIDVATRYPLGYYLGFEPPSYLAVMECLYHAITPKTGTQERYGTAKGWQAHGLPTTLVIDNGKEFIGKDLEMACSQLGIELLRTPVKTPHFKGTVERAFGSLNTRLFHQIGGTTFSNITQKGDYKSVKKAFITLEKLDKILHKHIVDVYAETRHRGLNGIPARRWEAHLDDGWFPRLPHNARDLWILLGRNETRVVNHYGIDLNSIRYQSQDLIHLRHKYKKVQLKYHPNDLSHIYVYEPDEERYLKIPALDQVYTEGLSLWKHKIIKKYMKEQKQDNLAIAEAKQQIRETLLETRNKKTTNKKVARWGKDSKQKEQKQEKTVIPSDSVWESLVLSEQDDESTHTNPLENELAELWGDI